MKTDNNMIVNGLKIPEDFYGRLSEFVNTFNKNGFECYLIGGCVRDLILGYEIYDYDFATNAKPEEVMKLFRRVIPTGIKHGTVTVLVKDLEFEVTTFRSDGMYLDGRRPDKINYAESLDEDVMRRDFTINGMAYDLKTSEVIDHSRRNGGSEKRGIIRTIGGPRGAIQ